MARPPRRRCHSTSASSVDSRSAPKGLLCCSSARQLERDRFRAALAERDLGSDRFPEAKLIGIELLAALQILDGDDEIVVGWQSADRESAVLIRTRAADESREVSPLAAIAGKSHDA